MIEERCRRHSPAGVGARVLTGNASCDRAQLRRCLPYPDALLKPPYSLNLMSSAGFGRFRLQRQKHLRAREKVARQICHACHGVVFTIKSDDAPNHITIHPPLTSPERAAYYHAAFRFVKHAPGDGRHSEHPKK